MSLRKKIRSPGTKKCASGKTKIGKAAMVIPAKAEGTCCWPQLSSAKGIALDSSPTKRTKRQTAISLKLGKAMPRQCIRQKSAMAPMVIRPAARVSGSKSRNAMRTTMKAPPQIIAMKAMRSQLITPGDVMDVLSHRQKKRARPVVPSPQSLM